MDTNRENLKFEWDEDKRLRTLKDRGIDFVDAAKIFSIEPIVIDRTATKRHDR